MLKATSLRKLPAALLLALVSALVRAAGLALTGHPAQALQVLWAWGWNVKELPVTIVHRRRLQRRRKVDDDALKPLRAPVGLKARRLLVRYVDQLTTARSPEDENALQRWS
jgi:hypothetical protein